MKKPLTFLIPLIVCLGLPASFIAQALHTDTPLLQTPLGQWLLPLLAVAVVLFIGCVVVHHLREDDRLETLARFGSKAPKARS